MNEKEIQISLLRFKIIKLFSQKVSYCDSEMLKQDSSILLSYLLKNKLISSNLYSELSTIFKNIENNTITLEEIKRANELLDKNID